MSGVGFGRPGVTLVCSAADRDDHLRCGASPDRVCVVPPWIDADVMRAISPEATIPGRLVFMGALDRIANVAAARFSDRGRVAAAARSPS